MTDAPLSAWKRPICWVFGHSPYNADPTDYIGWASGEHEGEVPIGGCKRCGKSWWMNEGTIHD